MIRRVSLVLVAFLFGCASTYDQTYEDETRRLEAEDRAAVEAREAADEARLAGEQATYDEAKRYAAVIYFETGQAVINETGHKELVWFAQQIAGAPPSTRVLVQGFADATGGDTLNQGLSEERAQAVATALEILGVDRSRLLVQGFASNFPAADNAEGAGRKNNRRVEVTLQ